MSQRRGTTTNQISNVIQVLQLGRKTGVLSVERDESVSIEKGIITFVHGHITEAHTGRLSGQAALSLLSIWGPCRFTFTPTEMEKITRPVPAIPSQSSPALADLNKPGSTAPLEKIPREPLAQPSAGPLPSPAAPQRIKSTEESLRTLERAGLSRTHRHLLLLLDGQRSIIELSRLMNWREDDIWNLLRDLAQIGLI